MVTWSTSVVCFICYDKFNFASSKEENDRRITSFKMFLRYLGVGIFEHFPTGVNLCEGCSSRLNRFWQLYQEFENLRLCLDDFIRAFHNRMKIPISENSCNTIKGGGVGNQNIAQLRKAVIRKCATKVSSIPFIKLERVIVLSTDNMKIETPSSPVLESIRILPHIKTEVNDGLLEDSNDPDFTDHQELSLSSSDSEIELPTKPKRIFKSKKTFQSSTKVYKCTSCHKSFQKYGTFLIHKRTHPSQPIQRKKFLKKCNFCNKFLANTTSSWIHKVRKHIMEFHASRIPPGVTQPELQEATDIILEKKKTYPSMNMGCPFCSRLYQDQRLLRFHVQIYHFDKVLLTLENPKDPSLQKVHDFHARIIGRPAAVVDVTNYANISNLIFDPNSTEKPFQCTLCESSFKEFKFFENHTILWHTLVIFENKLPPRTTQSMLDWSINGFIRKGKSFPGEKRICSVCSLGLPCSTTLKSHLLTTHLDKVIENMKEPSASDFKNVEILKRNKCTFKCWTCGDYCGSKGNLKLHRIQHHPGPLLGCKYCKKKTFPRAKDLSGHVMANHTFHFFEDNLPSGTTESELERAIGSVISETKVPGSNRTHYKCSQCLKVVRSKRDIMKHVSGKHFEQVCALCNPVDVKLWA